ncbi:restriction endonuclease subunit S [Flavobacterium degerlachei]|jgi:restriction endonuclease S subunit|uniref:Type I restriction enzyme, S subunit/type I restriction enzyme M protein n=1 Tax=Flavobacterium degerlachei TaxID=229203 RepID=A0A1H3CEZ6_9FLAO|nr:restriction endonuclease subunit S [Flavobacterium degerlachei]SDX52686.1 type I restriction enzyme, S subunit/type I restriction enzyme M protein [Flavobacterium degerlachei]
MQNKSSKNWKYKRLGDMFTFVGGGTPRKTQSDYWNGSLNWASVKDVKGNILKSTKDFITEKGLKNSASNLAEKNDVILITRILPGRSIITNIHTAINQDLKIAKPKFETTSKFIYYFFSAIERDCIKKSSGTTVLGITLNNLNELLIPDLSLEEQNSIVSKIEELFSELDKGIEDLKIAQLQLKTYRQSVLKYAFEGKLTNKKVKDVVLPKGWKVAKLSEVSSLITKGASPKWQGINYTQDNSQVLFITSENVRENYIDISKPKYLELAFNEKQKRSILQYGDILINIVGASIGRAAIFNLKINSNINQAVSIVRLNNETDKHYISYFLNSNKAFSYYNLNKVDVARANLSLADIGNIEFWLPTLQEQQKIVQEIESRLSVADKMEESIAQSLQQAEVLRQSILKKAFSGELV